MNHSGLATLGLHAGQSPDPTTNARAVPIYQTASYLFNSTEHAANLFALKEPGNIYTRLMNPTTDVLEKRMAAIDGGTGALATSSGMAAIFLAISNLAQNGDHIITSSSLYGGTETLFRHTFPRFGISVSFIDDFTPQNIAAAIRDNTKLIYAETIGNPKGDILDFTPVAATAHAHGIPLMVDNTFAPGVCKPIEHGADIVVYSCTKWIGGHGTTIGGMIVDGGKFPWNSGRFPEFTSPDPSYHGIIYWDALGNVPNAGNIAYITKARVQGLRNLGPCISPTNSFYLLQGIETLAIRLKAHAENTLALALFLKAHPHVAWVNSTALPEHPSHQLAKKYIRNNFFGAVFGLGIQGGAPAAEKFINHLKLASHLANVGDGKTLVIHPWSTTHQQLSDNSKHLCGISPEFIRVSVGIEDIEDIKADFNQALQASQL